MPKSLKKKSSLELFNNNFIMPFDPKFLNIINDAKKNKRNINLIKESYDVYSCPCLNPKFIDYFLKETKKYSSQAPNSMNNYGLVLNDTPLKSFIIHLQENYLEPLFKFLFPKYQKIKNFHAFTVKYSETEDSNLDPHTDDSDITFNICLIQPEKGSELVFCGNIDSINHRKVSKIYNHQQGFAIIHLGHRRHTAIDIGKGKRENLVIWNRFFIKPVLGEKKKEKIKPDLFCISYTHDKDYFDFFVKPPKGHKKKSRNPWCCEK
tara:strand:- start:2 stop:793 length:792 start_codon:yes stop_codon:yes gene_type:complete